MAINDTLTNDEAVAWWQAEVAIQLNRLRRDNDEKDELEEESDE